MVLEEGYKYFLIGIIVVVLIYFLSFKGYLQVFSSIICIVFGSFLITLGSWFADLAFTLVSPDAHYRKLRRNISKTKIFIFFLKNYKPSDLWNFSWFVTFVGVILLVAGTLMLGLLFRVYIV